MTDDIKRRVNRLLEDAGALVESLDPDGASDDDVEDEFDDLSREANDLVSQAEPVELLDAVGATDVSEDDPPETLSNALAQSDPDTVVALRKLLVLSRMDDETDDSTATERLETLRELYDETDDSDDEDEDAGHDDEDDAPDATADTADGNEQGSDPEDPEDGEGDEADEADEADEDDEDGVAEQLRETLLDGVDEFRDGVRDVRADLEGRDEADAEDEEADETDETGGGDDQSHGSGSDGTMLSTLPSRDRSDLRRPSRFSTVRGKNND
jgi:ribonuclease E